MPGMFRTTGILQRYANCSNHMFVTLPTSQTKVQGGMPAMAPA